jgi:hypothetical protein
MCLVGPAADLRPNLTPYVERRSKRGRGAERSRGGEWAAAGGGGQQGFMDKWRIHNRDDHQYRREFSWHLMHEKGFIFLLLEGVTYRAVVLCVTLEASATCGQ